MIEEDETEIHTETPQPSRIGSLIKRIETSTGEQPVELGSQSYSDLTTQELDEAFTAIDANPKVKEVQVAANVSRNGAQHIVDSFLTGDVESLDFDIFSRVMDPSQYKLQRFQDRSEADVEAFNDAEDRRVKEIVSLFSVHKSRKRDRDGKLINTVPELPAHLLEAKLVPTIKRRKAAKFAPES